MNLFHPMKAIGSIYLVLFMCFATNSLSGEPVSTNCLHCPDLAPIIEVPSTGQTTIWADSLATLGVEDSCGSATYRIWYSYMDSTDYPDQRKDWALPSDSATASEVLDQLPEAAIFYCEANRGEGVATFQVRIYRVDTNGHWEFCEARVIQHDIYTVCFDDGESVIEGAVTDAKGRPVNKAFIELSGGYQNLVDEYRFLGEDGKFRFYVYHGYPWVLKATREGDAMNGVDVSDLIILNRHLQGIELMDDPHKIIASDATGDLSVNILDLLELRSVILGIHVEFQNIASWRVINSEESLDDITNYSIPKKIIDSDQIDIDTLTRAPFSAHYTAIKVGDLNWDSNPGYWLVDPEERHTEEAKRSSRSFSVSIEDKQLQPNREITVPVHVDEEIGLAGYQFTFRFDPEALEYVGLEDATAAYVNDENASRGVLTMLWYDSESKLIEKGEELLSVIFKSRATSRLKNQIQINSDFTDALLVDSDDNEYSFQLNWRSNNSCFTCDSSDYWIEMHQSGEMTLLAQDFIHTDVDSCEHATYRVWYNYMDSSSYPDQRKDWKLPSDTSSGDVVLESLPDVFVLYCDILKGYIRDTIPIQIFRVDSSGDWESCSTDLFVSDRFIACRTEGPLRLIGDVTDCMNRPVKRARMEFSGGRGQQVYFQNTVNMYGRYRIYFNPGYKWTVSGSLDDDILNGLTVEDVLALLNHLNGSELIKNPYKLLAADVNGDYTIDIRDMIELRMLLLGIKTELQNNSVWELIDADYDFDGLTSYTIPNDWKEARKIVYDSLITSDLEADFKAIKIGDLNGDVELPGLKSDTDRSHRSFPTSIQDKEIVRNRQISVPIRVDKDVNLAGYQFTVRFDPNVLEFAGLEDERAAYINDEYASRGVLTTLWYDAKTRKLESGEILISLKFKSKANGKLKDQIQINSDFTDAILVDDQRQQWGIELKWSPAPIGPNERAAKLQPWVSPNPFNDEATIEFYVEQRQPVSIELFGLDGEPVYRKVIDATGGRNLLSLDNIARKLTAGAFVLKVTTQYDCFSSVLVKGD